MPSTFWSPYVLFQSTLPGSMCDDIINAHCNLEYTRGGLLKDGKVTHNSHRNVDLQGSELQWLNALLIGYTRLANSVNFDYDLTDHDKERLQFSKYDKGMYFQTHMDYDVSRATPAITRKLSVTVQLSDPSSYTGGELIIENCDGSSFTCPKDQGTVIVFDSRWLHRVQPVKSGTRYSLVKWVHGDKPLR